MTQDGGLYGACLSRYRDDSLVFHKPEVYVNESKNSFWRHDVNQLHMGDMNIGIFGGNAKCV